MIWVKAFRLVSIALALILLNGLIGGCGQSRVPVQSLFIVSDLSIQPEVVQPNEIVTITVSVTNEHNTWGIYNEVKKGGKSK